jgi:hypothetical protein
MLGSLTTLAAVRAAVLALGIPAAEPDPKPGPTASESPSKKGDAPVVSESDELLRRVEALEDARERDARRRDEEAAALDERNAALEQELEDLRARQEHAERRLRRQEFLTARLHGYLDVGFFWVQGDGTGVRPDLGHATLGLDDVAPDVWVFLGDPLSTAINARGDVADAGDSQAVALDAIRSNGNPTFLVNTFNVAPSIGLGERVLVEGMVDFLPRGRMQADYGETALRDHVDIKLANIRWNAPTRRFGLALSAGKIDSVFGREYRIQEAPDRLTVTPSLMCRYTCGRPLGVKSRWTFLRERQLAVNVSVTNGSTMQESFGVTSVREHNILKTGAGRISYRFPVGSGLEIGASGLVGAQDLQPRNDVLQWQYGVDVHLDVRGLELTGEFVQVNMPGRDGPGRAPCAITQCLEAMSAYGLVGYRVTNWFVPVFRTDWRDARHTHGGVFHYESHLVRFTPGVRFEAGNHVVIKAEYTINRELGRIPQFPNDVFTSSVVAWF